jgi:hypothetical protein
MPRGLPDYYNPDTLVSQRLANVEEVVTAIQGIANLDNRGTTLSFEHFAEGISGWNTLKTGDGVLAVVSTAEALIEPVCMLLNGGSDSGGGTTTAQKRINVRGIAKVGFEFSFHYRRVAAKLTAGFGYSNGVTWYHGSVIIDRSAKVIQITDDLTPTTIVTLPTSPIAGDWLIVKLVIDFENAAYVRLLVGQTQFDISEYALYDTADANAGFLRAQFLADAKDDSGAYAYIGHVAITIDEP